MKFNNRHPNKSPEEMEFEVLNQMYYRRFGKYYVIQMFLGPSQWEEINSEIKKCIETGKAQTKKPYVEGLLY